MDHQQNRLAPSLQRQLIHALTWGIALVGLVSALLSLLSAYHEAGELQDEVLHQTAQALGRNAQALAALPAPTHDRVSAILLIGEAVAKVPGVKPGIAAAATLTCIQENTGITTEVLRRALPAANEPVCALNATQLGKLLNCSPKATNRLLSERGLQFRNDRDEWELTEAGDAWAEAMPYSRNGHSGYQILWNPAVAEQLKEVA